MTIVTAPANSSAAALASLTREEAEERAALIEVDRYDVAVDLRGLFEGEVLEATSTVRFSCRTPGASTFVDCTAEIRHATLNGVALDPATAERGRLPLPDLQADNVLVVASAQSDTGTAHGIKRTVDPSDKNVYLWTSFEPDMARRAWANFDQPDLKSVHGFTVSAPETWTVLSNSRHTSIDALDDGGRLWTFEDTPRLSTYVTVVNAGPFYELRDQRGGYDLGLFCRQSLKAQLDRDAPELFLLTEQGLAWFGEKFGAPFAQDKYDQVFVPDMGGAMENWGCVTWGDGVLLRGTPTYDQRRRIALILLHEMAHMWFGDLVTMKWWDDLWLNEAFASWAATWAAVGATTYTDCWAGYLAADKQEGYRVDLGPASHPIRGDVPDVSQAMANFDAISYHKGQAVLRQLSAYAGDDAFVEGLRAYFRDHAWGNTRLEDLTGAIGAACGEDLTGWQKDWLDRAGTDTLTLTGAPGQWRLRAEGPHGESARSHRLDIGCYAVDGDSLRHVGDVAVRTSGGETEVDLPSCDLRLVNDHDLTFAAARPDPASLELMLTHAGRPPRRRLPFAGGRHCLRHAGQGRAQRRGDPDLHPRGARDRAGRGRRRALPPARRTGRGQVHPDRQDPRTPPPGRRPRRRTRGRTPTCAPARSSRWRPTPSPPSTSLSSTRRRTTTSPWPGGSRRPAPPAAATTPRPSSSCSSATPTPTPPSTPSSSAPPATCPRPRKRRGTRCTSTSRCPAARPWDR